MNKSTSDIIHPKDEKLPEMNQRVKKIVAYFAEGNVSKFVKLLNEKSNEEEVSQQKFNRIFNIDSRTKKYPSVPTSITIAITNRFVEVNPKWLMTGEGEMFFGNTSPNVDEPFMTPEEAKSIAIERKFALFMSFVYGLKGVNRSVQECLDELDNDAIVILANHRRSNKKKD